MRSIFDRLAFIAGAFNVKRNLYSLIEAPAGHLRALDGWRALAMLWIMLQHSLLVASSIMSHTAIEGVLNDSIFRIFLHGHFAVDIFFVISGFLIGGILIREYERSGTIDLIRFYVRRSLRMFPIYYFVLMLAIVFKIGYGPVGYDKTSIWPNFFYLNNFIPFNKQFVAWTWSLAVEEQFYLFCPIFVIFAFRSRIKFVNCTYLMIVATLVCQFWILSRSPGSLSWLPLWPLDLARFSEYFDSIYDKPYIRFGGLFIGVLAAYLYQRKLDRIFFASKIRSWLAIALAVLVAILLLSTLSYRPGRETTSLFYMTSFRLLFSVVIMLLIFASLYVPVLNRFFSHRWFYPMFQLSYGAYLMHIFFGVALLTRFSETFFPAADFSFWKILRFGLLTSSLALLSAVPLYVCIEKPFMNMRRPRVGA